MFVKQYLTRLAQNHVVRHVYQSAIVAMRPPVAAILVALACNKHRAFISNQKAS